MGEQGWEASAAVTIGMIATFVKKYKQKVVKS